MIERLIAWIAGLFRSDTDPFDDPDKWGWQ